jgi:hypothetical protein
MSESVIHEDITYVPHHRVVTASGSSHFSSKLTLFHIPYLIQSIAGFADALAEFIDNSIQATKSHPEKRQVDIHLFLHTYGPERSYVVISDNGTGMNTRQIKEFATYSLDQESRGNDPSTNSCDISKFGVGAKQGGFYLGDRLHIFTKNREEESVLEFCLDENKFQEKFQGGEQVTIV